MQGVLVEDDLMVRDDLKMLATAKLVGIKPVQLSKLSIWMKELKDLGNAPQRVRLPHERSGSNLELRTRAKASIPPLLLRPPPSSVFLVFSCLSLYP